MAAKLATPPRRPLAPATAPYASCRYVELNGRQCDEPSITRYGVLVCVRHASAIVREVLHLALVHVPRRQYR
jgi:hypothetical protein